LLTPLLLLFSQLSLLLWVSPTPDLPFASLRTAKCLRLHTISGAYQVSRVSV